jgi:hypothetical protein
MTAQYGQQVPFGWAFGTSPNTAVLDGSGDIIGGVFRAPKAGNIDRIAVYCTATAGTVPSYDARLDSVLNGYPNGIIAADRSGSVTPSANTLHLITLTTAYTVAKNELIATRLNSASATGSNNATFNLRINQTPAPGVSVNYHNRAVQDLSVGSYSAQLNFPCVVPVYSDGSYFPLCVPRAFLTPTDFSSTSTPDEIGVRWTQVGADRTVGGSSYIRMLASGSDWKMKLYKVSLGDSASPIAEATLTQSVENRGTTEEGLFQAYWSSTVDLEDGADYRLTTVPTSSNQVRVIKLTYGSEDMRKAMSHAYFTSRTRTADGDAGTWTDDTAASMMGVSPNVDQNNAVGGLITHPGMSGRLAA